jgi:hypothetical protein
MDADKRRRVLELVEQLERRLNADHASIGARNAAVEGLLFSLGLAADAVDSAQTHAAFIEGRFIA